MSRRTQRRLIRHHLVLAVVSASLMLAVYFVLPSKAALFRWSMATAYTGAAMIIASMLVGPLNVLCNRRNPISTDLRRDVGIWSAIISFAHVGIGLQIHMGSMLLYFFREAVAPEHLWLRSDLFGFANYAGLIATTILAFLLGLSNDIALRWLGGRRWKALQRCNYALIIIVVLHGIAYQIMEKQHLIWVVIFVVMITIAGAVQIMGFRRHRRGIMPRKIKDDTLIAS